MTFLNHKIKIDLILNSSMGAKPYVNFETYNETHMFHETDRETHIQQLKIQVIKVCDGTDRS